MKKYIIASKKILTSVLMCCCIASSVANTVPDFRFDKEKFRNFSASERFRFVHQFPFEQMSDGAKLSSIIEQMMLITEEENDDRSGLALAYYVSICYSSANFRMPQGQSPVQFMENMHQRAIELGYAVEEVVAGCNLINALYLGHKIPKEQYYLSVQQYFNRIKEMGFDKFKDYNISTIIFVFSKCIWELGDQEKAYQYLRLAEKHINLKEEWFNYTQILSYLQTYWKNKKNYAYSAIYAKRILHFHQTYQPTSLEYKLWNNFWRNFSSIEMATLLIEQGKIAEGTAYANRGYQLIKSRFSLDTTVSMQAEYDALMVLIPLKLKLNSLQEVKDLLQRAMLIKQKLEPKALLGYFKPIRLFKYAAEYYEKQGDLASALKFTQEAQRLDDSLRKTNDAQKLAQLQIRFEVERYVEHLKNAEKEKQLQTYIRNAVILILLLIVALVYVNYRRLYHKNLQKEKELDLAKHELQALLEQFKKTSEWAESLRHENQQRLAEESHHAYIAQLLNSTILTEEDWKNFKSLFEKVHPGYIQQQKELFPELTNAETRLLMLEKLELNSQEMANMLGVNKNTIHQTRLRMRRKTESKV